MELYWYILMKGFFVVSTKHKSNECEVLLLNIRKQLQFKILNACTSNINVLSLGKE